MFAVDIQPGEWFLGLFKDGLLSKNALVQELGVSVL